MADKISPVAECHLLYEILNGEFDMKLYCWAFQSMVVMIGFGWVAVEIITGNLMLGIISSFLILLNAIFAAKLASNKGSNALKPGERVLISICANLLSFFNMAGILMNFTALVDLRQEGGSNIAKKIAYIGLPSSVLIFAFSSSLPAALHIRSLIGVALALVTISMAIGVSSSSREKARLDRTGGHGIPH